AQVVIEVMGAVAPRTLDRTLYEAHLTVSLEKVSVWSADRLTGFNWTLIRAQISVWSTLPGWSSSSESSAFSRAISSNAVSLAGVVIGSPFLGPDPGGLRPASCSSSEEYREGWYPEPYTSQEENRRRDRTRNRTQAGRKRAPAGRTFMLD